MFSSSVGRVVRTSCTASPATPSLITAIRPISHRASSHQRRQSSSKTSVPPDGSKGIAPSPSSSAARTSKKKGKDVKEKLVANGASGLREISFSQQYPNLPVVKAPHLKRDDIALSSFFALHRPISLHNPFPETTSEAQFNALFEPRSGNTQKKFEDVMFTLGSAVESMESGLDERTDLGFAHHLDGTPFDSGLSDQQRIPFRPPPPPVPQNEEGRYVWVQGHPRRIKPKSWSTTIVVTEYINPSGEKEYRAKSSPLARLPANETANVEEPPHSQQPFLERMRLRESRRQDFWNQRGVRAPVRKPGMFLISVKRQRKLKMKKHKYKKLMKRTRNLRRKLGKL